MTFYSAYGLTIDSEISLSTVYSGSRNSDVVVEIADLKHENSQTINSNQLNNILGSIPGVAKFLISNGTKILVEPESGINESILSPYILGSAMAVLLQQRGLLVLHASCVIVNDVAVAFLGNSGDGKSTICSAFHSQGYRILTDDVMAIDVEDNIKVIPSIPEIKLRSDSSNSLGYQAGNLSPLHPITQKKIYKIESGFSNDPIALKKIYLLDKGEQNQIKPLSNQESFIKLVKHTRAVKTLKSQNLDQAHFLKCAKIANKVELSRLIRKFALSELPSLVSLVEQDLS